MTAERYAEWVRRGRAHQVEGRAIDAMLCFRRAVREAAPASDARFHLGEIAWQLGRKNDAITQWKAVIEAAPHHRASLQACAEALAATGQFAAAENMIDRLLERRPDEPRAGALATLLRSIHGDAFDGARWPGIAEVLGESVMWLLPLLAEVVQRMIASGSRETLAESSRTLLDSVLAIPVVEGNEDSLRIIAQALAGARDARAEPFARRYAECCRAMHRSTMPLLWPLRTAGVAVRAGLLLPHFISDERQKRIAALIEAVPAETCTWTYFVSPQGDRDNRRIELSAITRALPKVRDAAARALASLDLDVLIDAAGLDEPFGPLLALRPARTLWAFDCSDRRGVPLLTDRDFDGEDSAMIAEAIRALHAEARALPHSGATAEELLARWDDAVRAHRQGNLVDASAGYDRVLEQEPGHAQAHYLKGVLLRDQSARDEALVEFRAAVAAAPFFVDALVALANLLLDCGDAVGAAEVARAGIAPSNAPATLWRTLGRAESKRGDGSAAAMAFNEALRREPLDGETHCDLGVALQMQRHVDQAARAYQRALALAPQLDAAHYNLGVIFSQQGNAAAAISAFMTVLDRAPHHVLAYKALSEALLAAGRIDAWFANFERFEKHCPEHIAVAALALEVSAYRADFTRVERYLDQLRHDHFIAPEPTDLLDALQQLLYLLLFFDVEPDLLERYGRMHDAVARAVYGEPLPRNARRRPGKLRIGYLSADFRNHVMGKMMWEVLRYHDAERFQIFAYSAADARDEWTKRIAGECSRFESVAELSDHDAARRIAADDLDVLVDLSTHTKGARPGILAAKPARVQVTYVASAGTVAMSAIDFKLTDRYADLELGDSASIESPLVMEGCVYPYRHVDAAANSIVRREALRIAPDAIVVAAFCTPLKLSRRCLALWREVLVRLPRAILAFSPIDPALRSVYARIAATADLDASRIVFVPQGRDEAENQARYRLVDFVLDPMPYGGVNGTLEAIDMGVPVVTLVGRRHAERTSYSILANLGVTDTLAYSGREYVDLAVRLATDGSFMRELRARIKTALTRSALTDMRAHTRNLERAYVRALEQRAPEAFEATPLLEE